METTHFLRLTKNSYEAYSGLTSLKLSLIRLSDLVEVDHVYCVSGQPTRQVFRRGTESKAGSMEPIPEGYYVLGELDWAGGAGNYVQYHNAGLGPVFVRVDPAPGMVTERSEIGIHLDANKVTSPGTAGCLGLSTNMDLQKVVSWFNQYAPKKLTVNWGLGTVETKLPYPGEKSSVPGWKVMLEVGHGPYLERDGTAGFEEGANGVGTTEYKENKYRADVIASKLRGQGIDVIVNDQQETLNALGAMAAGRHIFVSLHLNAFNESAQGCETLIHRDGSDEDSKLAGCIQKRCVQVLGIPDRGVKRQGLAVLGGVPASVKAACLSEAFFIDALPDAKTIRAWSDLSTAGIANGILDYIAASHI